MNPPLSRRLRMIADMVRPEDGVVADIGTDHAYLPIALALQGKTERALALDLRDGPLERAAAHVRAYGLNERIAVRKSDGLTGLRPGEAQTIVCAGMGGALIRDILAAGGVRERGVRQLLLSPQSEAEALRQFLRMQGFAITDEAMTEEDGKFYPAIRAAVEALPPGGRSDASERLPEYEGRSDGPEKMPEAGRRFNGVETLPASYRAACEALAVHAGCDGRRALHICDRYGPYLLAQRDPALRRYLLYRLRLLDGILQTLTAGEMPEAARWVSTTDTSAEVPERASTAATSAEAPEQALTEEAPEQSLTARTPAEARSARIGTLTAQRQEVAAALRLFPEQER